jgi:hypothetical protein
MDGSDIEFSVRSPLVLTKLKIAVFYSQFDTWSKVYGTGMTCGEKYAHADCYLDLHGGVGGGGSTSLNAVLAAGNTQYQGKLSCASTTEDGWLYLAFINHDTSGSCVPLCDGPVTGVTYDFRLRNLDQTFPEFSAEESNKLPYAILEFSFACLLGAFSVHLTRELLALDKFHHTVKILVASVVFFWASSLSALLHLGVYASDGEGTEGARKTSSLLFWASDALLLLQTILVAKGWTIVRRKISATGRVKIAAALTIYSLGVASARVWYETVYTEATALTEWETWPGAFVITMRCLVLVWFLRCVSLTMRKYKAKRAFYTKFGIFLALWIAALPLTVLFALSAPSFSCKSFLI